MSTDILEKIARNIRKYRVENNLSQEELAFKCGLHRTYISLLERKKKNVSILILQRISNSLKIDLTSLLR